MVATRYPSTMAVFTHRRPRATDRPVRHERRAAGRRRLGYVLAVAAALLIALSARVLSSPASSSPTDLAAGLAAGAPQRQTLATLGSLTLFVPINQAAITGVVYHPIAGSAAAALRPVGRQRNADVFTRVWNRVFGDGDGGLPYDVAGGSTQAIELGAPDGTAVYAPLNGQVVALTANVISGDATRWGTILGIQPDDDPAHVLTISALTLDPPGAPSRPEIGRQVRVGQLLGRVRDTSSVVTSVLSRYVSDRGSGITLRLEPSVSGAGP